MSDAVPHDIREVHTIRKFGGADPNACRPDDLIEEIVLVVERGVLISQTVTRPEEKG